MMGVLLFFAAELILKPAHAPLLLMTAIVVFLFLFVSLLVWTVTWRFLGMPPESVTDEY
jgi:hypothetical protein